VGDTERAMSQENVEIVPPLGEVLNPKLEPPGFVAATAHEER
jgi:hypothetical protein